MNEQLMNHISLEKNAGLDVTRRHQVCWGDYHTQNAGGLVKYTPS